MSFTVNFHNFFSNTDNFIRDKLQKVYQTIIWAELCLSLLGRCKLRSISILWCKLRPGYILYDWMKIKIGECGHFVLLYTYIYKQYTYNINKYAVMTNFIKNVIKFKYYLINISISYILNIHIFSQRDIEVNQIIVYVYR